MSHWVAMQGVAAIQLGLVHLTANQESTQTTTMAWQTWYWRSIITPTSLKHVHRISIRVSSKKDGDFSDPLIAYRYVK